MTSNNTETTRYLCAAVNLDKKFRDYVLNEIVHEEFRALGPSYGVDLEPVVKHALASRHREDIRDISLAAVFVIAFLAIWAVHLSDNLPVLMFFFS